MIIIPCSKCIFSIQNKYYRLIRNNNNFQYALSQIIKGQFTILGLS